MKLRTHTLRFTAVMLMSLALALTVTTLLYGQPQEQAAATAASIHYVTTDGNCNGAAPCYASVQNAVDTAAAGDEIRVAAGTYTGVTNVPLLNTNNFTATQVVAVTKSITLRGGYTPADWTASDPVANETILDAQQQGRVMVIMGEIAPVVSGFTMRNGDATNLGGRIDYPLDTCDPSNVPQDLGGGIYIDHADAIIQENIITNNIASTANWSGGGAVALHCSGAALIGNMIELNTANGNVSAIGDNAKGGGIFAVGTGGFSTAVSAPTIRENTIQFNVAGGAGSDGGGIYLAEEIAATVADNIISQNDTTLSAFTANGNGGGLYLQNINNQPVEISGNIIQANHTGTSTSGFGGGVYLANVSDLLLLNNIIAANTARASGSAIYVSGYQGSQMNGRLIHNTIAANFGANTALYVYGSSYIANNMDVGQLALTNNIFDSHDTAYQTGTDAGLTMTVLDDHTLWDGSGTYNTNTGPGTTVQITNRLIDDPGLVGSGDYHLTPGSAAIDAGTDTGLTTDVDSHLRPIGQGVDIGADEIGASVAIPVGGGTIDATDDAGIGPVVNVPNGAVAEETVFVLTPLAGVGSEPADLTFAGQAFSLTASQNGSSVEGLNFSVPITVSLTYRDDDLGILPENTLVPLYLDGATWSDMGIFLISRDAQTNTVVFTTDHLSEFALFGRAYQLYLPAILR